MNSFSLCNLTNNSEKYVQQQSSAAVGADAVKRQQQGRPPLLHLVGCSTALLQQQLLPLLMKLPRVLLAAQLEVVLAVSTAVVMVLVSRAAYLSHAKGLRCWPQRSAGCRMIQTGFEQF
jgi:hypothetical protein